MTCDNGRYVVIVCWLLYSDMWQWPVCCYSMLIVMQWHVTMTGMLLYHVDCYTVTCDNGPYVVMACWLLFSDSGRFVVIACWLLFSDSGRFVVIACWLLFSDNGQYVVIACWLLFSDMWQWPVCCWCLFNARSEFGICYVLPFSPHLPCLDKA